MAEQPIIRTTPPETAEAFLADRQRFWYAWTHFVTGSVIVVVIVLILMAWFL